MEKDDTRTRAARLLGRLSAKAATPEQRKDRASKGGKAAQAKLTPEQRSERARDAAQARWAKAKKLLERVRELEAQLAQAQKPAAPAGLPEVNEEIEVRSDGRPSDWARDTVREHTTWGGKPAFYPEKHGTILALGAEGIFWRRLPPAQTSSPTYDGIRLSECHRQNTARAQTSREPPSGKPSMRDMICLRCGTVAPRVNELEHEKLRAAKERDAKRDKARIAELEDEVKCVRGALERMRGGCEYNAKARELFTPAAPAKDERKVAPKVGDEVWAVCVDVLGVEACGCPPRARKIRGLIDEAFYCANSQARYRFADLGKTWWWSDPSAKGEE